MTIINEVTKHFIIQAIDMIIKRSKSADVSIKNNVECKLTYVRTRWFNQGLVNLESVVGGRNLAVSEKKRAELERLKNNIHAIDNPEKPISSVIHALISECLVELTKVRAPVDLPEATTEQMLKDFVTPLVDSIYTKLNQLTLFSVDYQCVPDSDNEQDECEQKLDNDRVDIVSSNLEQHEPLRCFLHYFGMSIAHTVVDDAYATLKLQSASIIAEKEAQFIDSINACKLAIDQLDHTRVDYEQAKTTQVTNYILLLRDNLKAINHRYLFTFIGQGNNSSPDRFLNYTDVALGEVSENFMFRAGRKTEVSNSL
ncbi:MAG: hypothetical protein Q8R24_01585 [Legionellaceae bacterium]|nr:hypothetical protein [Legionellaceae bacterium]